MLSHGKCSQRRSTRGSRRQVVARGQSSPGPGGTGATEGPVCSVHLGFGARLLTRRNDMLWTLALVLLVLWALGLVSSVTMGGFVHVLLVAAVVLVIVRVIQGRRVL